MTNTTKIKVVQYMWGDHNRSYELDRKINEAYCQRHGYEYVVKSFPPNKNRSSHWEKIPAIQQELHHCDFLFYLDADAFFYSHELALENELLPYLGDKDILIAADLASEHLRNHPGLPNTGVIFFRNSESVTELLRIWNESSDNPELDHYRYERFHEQEALWRTIWCDHRNSFQLVEDYYLMNGYYGIFIRHLMALSDENRITILKTFMEEKNIR